MFTVIYTFNVLPGKVKDFIFNWEELTKLIYQFEGSFGSRLHHIKDLEYLAYAQWPDKETWSNSGSKLPEVASEFSKNMKAACASSTTNFELTVVSDLLAIDQFKAEDTNPKATGIGGVFFKSKNTEALKAWYAAHLGLNVDQYGSLFASRNMSNPKEINYLQWSLFKDDSDYFKPSSQNYMINYRVNDIEGLVEHFRKNKIKVLGDIASYDYGKFVHILDLEGNKIELWEPVDSIFNS